MTTTLNIYLIPVGPGPGGKPPAPRRLTNATRADVGPGQYQWTPDSASILYLADPDAGSRYRVWRVPVQGGGAAVDVVPLASAPRAAGAAPPRATLPPGLATPGINIGEFYLSNRVPGGALVTLDVRQPG